MAENYGSAEIVVAGFCPDILVTSSSIRHIAGWVGRTLEGRATQVVRIIVNCVAAKHHCYGRSKRK